MKISEMKESRFLKKEDCGRGLLVTIGTVCQENVGKEGEEEMLRYTLHFQEPNVKPMVLNVTKNTMIAAIAGSDETDNWTGTKIVLYEDPNIMFKGKVVGGIAVRAPRPTAKAAASPAPKQEPEEIEGDDLPF